MNSGLKSIHWGFILIMLIAMNEACGQKSFDKKVKSLYRNTVPLIHADELKSLREQNKDVYLLDVRSVEEFEVSKIEGADFVDYDSFNAENVEDIPRDAKVVLYCAIGYRSERVGEKMIEMGFTDVQNLYGGIFDWKNTDHEVINNRGEATDSVHTYNRNWSQWLYKGVKVYE
jgi:rhodanese-related sulfurtransferase